MNIILSPDISSISIEKRVNICILIYEIMRVIYIIYIDDQVSFILNYYEANCKLLFLWSSDVSVVKAFDFQSLSHRFNHRFTYIGFGN